MMLDKLRHTPLRIILIFLAVFAINVGIIKVVEATASAPNTIIRGSSFLVGNLRYYKLSNDPDGVAVAWGWNTDIESLMSSSESLESVSGSNPTSNTSWELSLAESVSHSEITSEEEVGLAPSPGVQRVFIDESVTYFNKTYAVRAIAPSGFRYCTFNSISLPQTINEIGKEAFYSCQNLSEIQIPKDVAEIPDSCFMDCRNLTNVYYSDADGSKVTSNSTITKVGAHAFTNCVQLISFNCPTSLQTIGVAAFQKCSRMMSFFFPGVIEDGAHNITNLLDVGDYAFSDCASLTLCYFEENLGSAGSTVGDYVFAECNSLMLYYTGNTVPFSSNPLWRKKHVATNKTSNAESYTVSLGASVYLPGKLEDDYVPININNGKLKGDPNYPGLTFTVQTDEAINIDCNGSNNLELVPASTYASVFKFDTPTENKAGYYTVDTGALILPANVQVGGGGDLVPLKTIKPNAFANNTDLRSLSFASGSNLVQICHEAFIGCSNIATLDFTNATNLLEISYTVFTGKNDVDVNGNVSSLVFPKSLKYLGKRAFYKFTKVTTLNFGANDDRMAECHLQFIGPECFFNLGSGQSGTCDLVLPYSLNDGESNRVKAIRAVNNGKYEGSYYAIMNKAFSGAKCLGSVTMGYKSEDWTPTTIFTNTANQISLASGSFNSCANLKCFRGSPRLFKIQKGVFISSTNLREMFLSNKCASANDTTNPWGEGGSIFGDYKNQTDSSQTQAFPHLVIYIEEASEPKSCGTPFGVWGMKWNSDCALVDDHTSNKDRLYRYTVPTYLDVGWHTDGNIKYYKLEKKSDTLYEICASGSALDVLDHNLNMVAYIPNQATLTRCYCKESITSADIDLSANSFSATIIGSSAFAQNKNEVVPGQRFVLPSGVTTIQERAFYRPSSVTGNAPTNANNPVTAIAPAGESITASTCTLPSSITNIERLAYYNNGFSAVSLSVTSLAFVGNMVFTSAKSDSGITSISNSGTFSNFNVIGNGVYYIGSSDQTLLYTAAGISAACTDIDSGTVAIGAKAFANSRYTSVTIPWSVNTIYASAFELSKATTITFASEVGHDPGIKTIGASIQLPSSNGDDYPTAFDVLDGGYIDYSSYVYGKRLPVASSFGAFAYCPNLANFDFTSISNSLEKIGYAAFQGCSKLNNMVGTKGVNEYRYFKYKGGTESSGPTTGDIAGAPANTHEGILDLSDCLALKSIGRYAFGECSLIKYVHLPFLYDVPVDSRTFHMGYDNVDGDFAFSKEKDGLGGSNVFASIASGYKIFVGEDVNTVYSTNSANVGSLGRYPTGFAYANNAVANIYYYVGNERDIRSGSDAGIRYWTKASDANGEYYLLFEDGVTGKKPYEQVYYYFTGSYPS